MDLQGGYDCSTHSSLPFTCARGCVCVCVCVQYASVCWPVFVCVCLLRCVAFLTPSPVSPAFQRRCCWRRKMRAQRGAHPWTVRGGVRTSSWRQGTGGRTSRWRQGTGGRTSIWTSIFGSVFAFKKYNRSTFNRRSTNVAWFFLPEG